METMKDVKVILLDLNPGSSLSEDLERILRSSEDDIQTLKESLGPSESSLQGSEIPNRLCRHHPDLIFLVASPLEPNRLDGLVQLMRNGGSEVPIILVAEGETDGM